MGGGFGYRLSAARGEAERLNALVNAQSSTGRYEAEVGSTRGNVGVRLTASGSLATVNGNLFVARKLEQSFAVVRAGGLKNVKVYADNQLVAKTNSKGIAIVPRLRPFERNPIRLDLADLPMDTIVSGGEEIVRPYNRSGVIVDFDVKQSRSALLTIVTADGPIPAGTVIRLQGSDEKYVAAPGGEVFLTELGSTNTAYGSWAARTCQFSFRLPQTDDPQPHLGKFTCAED